MDTRCLEELCIALKPFHLILEILNWIEISCLKRNMEASWNSKVFQETALRDDINRVTSIVLLKERVQMDTLLSKGTYFPALEFLIYLATYNCLFFTTDIWSLMAVLLIFQGKEYQSGYRGIFKRISLHLCQKDFNFVNRAYNRLNLASKAYLKSFTMKTETLEKYLFPFEIR